MPESGPLPRITAGLAVLLVLMTTVAFWPRQQQDGLDSAADETTASPIPEPAVDQEPRERELPAATASDPPEGHESRESTERLRTYELKGLILQANGDPAPAGMEIHDSLRPAREPLAFGDALGEFALTLAPGQHALYAHMEGWTTVRSGITRERPRWVTTIVIAPSIHITGRVVDTAGLAIAQAEVRVRMPREALTLPADALRTSVALETVVSTALDGSFELERTGRVEGAQIVANAPGFIERRIALPDSSMSELVVRMERPGQRPHSSYKVGGIVLHEDGTPAADATLRLGQIETHTGEDGRFELQVPRTASPNLPLIAVLKGFQPAFVADFPERLRSGDGFGEDNVVLRLGGSGARIQGRVITAAGDPCEGWQVSLWDPTMMDPTRGAPVFAENLTGPSEAAPAKTDAHGSFMIEGLFDRSYELAAWREGRLQVLREPGCVPDGPPVTIVVPADALERQLQGRLVSMRGVPLPHVRVTALVLLSEGWSGPFVLDWMALWGPEVETGPNGELSISGLPDQPILLRVIGEQVVDGQFPSLDPAQDWSSQVIEVAAKAKFGLELEPTAAFSSFSLLDETGSKLDLWIVDSTSARISKSVAVHSGRSAQVAVSEEAVSLELRTAEGESMRVPVTVNAGETTIQRTLDR